MNSRRESGQQAFHAWDIVGKRDLAQQRGHWRALVNECPYIALRNGRWQDAGQQRVGLRSFSNGGKRQSAQDKNRQCARLRLFLARFLERVEQQGIGGGRALFCKQDPRPSQLNAERTKVEWNGSLILYAPPVPGERAQRQAHVAAYQIEPRPRNGDLLVSPGKQA